MKLPSRFLLVALTLQLHAAPTIGAVRVTPMTAVVGSPTQVTVIASILDPTLIAGSVDLAQLNADGTTTILGMLHDDGLSGDAFAGDGVFTFLATLSQSSAGQVQLEVSAAFKGALKRVKSPMNVFFQAPNAPQQALAALAQTLTAGNRAAALNYVVQSDKNTNAINTLNQAGLNALAAMLRGASLMKSPSDVRIFQAPFMTPGGIAITIEISMVPGQNGQWLVDSW